MLLPPEHLLPPFLACLTIRLVPYLTPYPQLLEHRPHLQDDQRHGSAGHFLTKHDALMLLPPEHFLPPFLAWVTIRLVPFLTPYPQFLEHRPHVQDDQRQFTKIK